MSSKSAITTAGFKDDDSRKLNQAKEVLQVELKKDGSLKRQNFDKKVQELSGSKFMLAACFVGIMLSFIVYGIVMEYATSGGRKLHELSLIFITSAIYALVGYVGRYIRDEEPSTVPKWNMLVLAVLSMGSTFTSVRSLRYVIFPVQVLAKSCKPIPVMIFETVLGKRYPLSKYTVVTCIVLGVALFMGGGTNAVASHKSKDEASAAGAGADADASSAAAVDVATAATATAGEDEESSAAASMAMTIGAVLLVTSLCFDGAVAAYEGKLMHKNKLGPFDLMLNLQLGKAIVAFLMLVVFGQINYFFTMVNETGFILILLGLCGALGQVFIFVTISYFGPLTCSIIGLARKVMTLLLSIFIYHHPLSGLQIIGLLVSIGAMIANFMQKKTKKGGKGGGHGGHSGGNIGEIKTGSKATGIGSDSVGGSSGSGYSGGNGGGSIEMRTLVQNGGNTATATSSTTAAINKDEEEGEEVGNGVEFEEEDNDGNGNEAGRGGGDGEGDIEGGGGDANASDSNNNSPQPGRGKKGSHHRASKKGHRHRNAGNKQQQEKHSV